MNLQDMSNEKLKRKSYQALDMSALARQDGDHKDAERRRKEAEEYEEELKQR